MSMRLISIDVGIKNMAYCLLSVDNGVWTIQKWNVLPLGEETQQTPPPPQCQQFLKNGITTCKSRAVFQSPREPSSYYCQKHATQQSEWWIPSPEKALKNIKKEKIHELRERAKEWQIADFDKKTRPQLLEDVKNVLQNRLLCPVVVEGKRGAHEIHLVDIGKRFVTAMDGELRDEWHTITHVIIENQISPIATRMKTIQGMVSQYFIMRCPWTTRIEYVSSSNKLRHLERTRDEHTYKNNKHYSVEVGTAMLTDPHWKSFVQQFKKKDDLFDALLQGIAYIESSSL